MIIESGYDVLQALCGCGGDPPPGVLWMVGMDECLRLREVERVVDRFDGDLERELDELVSELSSGGHDVAYFALAWATPDELDREGRWLRDLDERVRSHPDLPRDALLGLLVFDAAGVFSSLPHCDFSLYRELEHLPRPWVIHGPHGAACRCPVCSAERRMMEEYDERMDADDEYDDHDHHHDDFADADDRADLSDGYGGPVFDPVLRRWSPDPARAYKRWTRDEEVALVRSHDDGLTVFDISWLLERQPGAIRARLRRLGRSTRPVIPPTVPPAR